VANIYDRGDDIRLTGTFTDAAGVVQDPTAGVILVKKPDATWVGYKTAFGWADQGNWNGADNTPTLANGTGTAGHFYTNTAVASIDLGDGLITFAIDDQVFYNGDVWHRIPTPNATTLTKSSTGVYYIDQPVAQSGTWYYRSEGAGTGQAGAEENYRVRISEF
jgi:hypothetical protein